MTNSVTTDKEKDNTFWNLRKGTAFCKCFVSTNNARQERAESITGGFWTEERLILDPNQYFDWIERIPQNLTQSAITLISTSEVQVQYPPSPLVPVSLDVIQKLFGFEQLVAGWDGYSAKTIEKGIINRASEALLDIYQLRLPASCSLEVFPTSKGGVQIEADCRDRSLELEICSDRLQYLKVERNGQEDYQEGVTFAIRDEIRNLIKWLLNQH